MADHTRSHTTTDLHRILGIPVKDLCKGFMKWNPSLKSPRNLTSIKEPNKSNGRKETYIISSPTTPLGSSQHQNVDESFFANISRSFSRSNSRRSKTPTPSPRSLSRNTSRRSTTPTPSPRSLSRNASRRSTTPTSLSRDEKRRSNSDSEFLKEPISRIFSRRTDVQESNEGPISSEANSTANIGSLSRNTSRRSPRSTPIIYSQSTALKKPPPIEKKLECTLEELCEGCVKKIMITRDAIVNGIIVQEEELLKIEIKPGWKKGTKITFEGKGDEKPGYLPADITFLIDERRHPLFSRDGDDLDLGVEIPLVNALTGCSITVPLLGGEKMSLSFDNIIYPGFQKVIKGQGMPNPRQQGIRGDLRIEFLVKFPSELSEEQRAEAATILQDCS
ncbi:dnaJ homolog subfamily B member 1-like [Benincasa hispida]|uniref:dnaJ homolog subfamily B member 1-like n=1 Tax=Benincasa hispida TaxID=102211 RepID=UPI00190026DB|nr:dnaJ homolog subfamily B member 1-like [Benincasa hispida]